MMYIHISYYAFKMEQGIDGLPGEKADKGAKGESGLNVRKDLYRISFTLIFVKSNASKVGWNI